MNVFDWLGLFGVAVAFFSIGSFCGFLAAATAREDEEDVIRRGRN